MDEAWLVDAAAWAAVGPYRAAPGAVVADSGVVQRALAPFREAGLATWSRLWAGTPPDANVDGLVELRAPGALGPGPPAPDLLALLEGGAGGVRGRLRRRPAGWSATGRLGFRDRCTVSRYRYPTGG